MGQGVVYESLNLAALWALPVLFVLEDNQYAQTTHKRLGHAGSLAARPGALLRSTHTEVDADDVFSRSTLLPSGRRHVRTHEPPYFSGPEHLPPGSAQQRATTRVLTRNSPPTGT